MTGAIPICEHGCQLREYLVVTGPERGNIWFDDRADWFGLYPDKTTGRERLTFLEWYRLWLDDCLAKAERRNAEPRVAPDRGGTKRKPGSKSPRRRGG